jgi:ribose transport system substrate-binding protein
MRRRERKRTARLGQLDQSILPSGGNVLFISGPAGNSRVWANWKVSSRFLGLVQVHQPGTVRRDELGSALPAGLTAEIAKTRIDVIVSRLQAVACSALPGSSTDRSSDRHVGREYLGCFWTDNPPPVPDSKLLVATGSTTRAWRQMGCRAGDGWSTRGGSLCGSPLQDSCPASRAWSVP